MPGRRQSFSFPITTIAGSSFGNFLRVTSGRRVGFRYLGKFLLSGLITIITEPFSLVERLQWNRRINKMPVPSRPVFIIGFWRSGTTLMHNLLSNDPRFGYVTTYHGIFPHLLLSNQWWLKHLVRFLVPEKRPADNMKLDLEYPQEEEFALGNMHPYSFYNFWYFPDYYNEYQEKYLTFEKSPGHIKDKWKQKYLWFIRKSLINTQGEVFLSKNPAHTCRIPLILELFPDARFIYMYRNPYDVYQSAVNFFSATIPALQFHKSSEKTLSLKILDTYKLALQRYYATRHLVPASQLIEVKFEDFEKNKLKTVEEIYEKLSVGGFDGARPLVAEYINGIRDYQKNVHQYPPDVIQQVNDAAGEYFARMGYEMNEIKTVVSR